MIKTLFGKAIGFFVNRFVQDSIAEVKDGRSTSPQFQAVCHTACQDSCVLLNNNGALPLKNKTVALFGRVQINSFFSGYGSGGDVKAPYRISFLQGIENSQIHYDKDLAHHYKTWVTAHPPYDGFWGFWPYNYEEMPLSEQEIQSYAKNNSVAVYFIGRSAGEDRDNQLKRGSWYLTKQEERMLKLLRAHFQELVVVVNSGSLMDMSWVKSYGVDATLLVWQGGQEMGNAVAQLLEGTVSPSGKLADTIALYPHYPSQEYGNKKCTKYTEDIYVGYRYFQTFAPEKVLYPFGFGLSYTQFSWGELTHTMGERLQISLTVQNVGEVAGKEVVQVYCQPPQGEMGKPQRVLVGFAKTKLLQAGESQRLTIEVEKRAFAYYNESKCAFCLDEGEYTFLLAKDSQSSELAFTYAFLEELLLQTEIVCPLPQPIRRMANFGGALGWENTPECSVDLRQRVLKNLPQQLLPPSTNCTWNDVLEGKAKLEEFVACLTEEEMEQVLRGSNHGMYDPNGVAGNAGIMGGTSESLRKRGIPVLSTNDGFSGVRLQAHATLIPIATALASTFDQEICYAVGAGMAREMVECGSHVLLAPNVNIHRNPLCGRNFEYFSEDPLLTGILGSAYVLGVQQNGASATVKHFACNNQEYARHRNDSYVSQRALREIYLWQFEYIVKKANPDFVMMSYNHLNGVENSYQYDLATTVLRGEWGYQGCVMTDWWMDFGKSPIFDNVTGQAYRVRAQVDVLMPGAAKFGRYKGKCDGTLLKSLHNGGITKAEMQRSICNLLKICVKYSQLHK